MKEIVDSKELGEVVMVHDVWHKVLAPETRPKWMLDGTKPTRLAWHLKAQALPEIYWLGMLRGREWLAGPHHIEPAPQLRPAVA